MIDEVLPALLDGQRIDRCVSLIADCTRSEASAAISAGLISLDGHVVSKPSVKVKEGQLLHVESNPTIEVALPLPQSGIDFEIVFQDDDLLVIDKPAGLVVHPGAGNPDGTLVNALLERFPSIASVGEERRPGIVHRLDKGTSGLMLAALSEDAYEGLVAQLGAHSVRRTYTSLIWGHLETTHGSIDAPVGRSKRNPQQMTVTNDGRPAVTHYEVMTTYSEPANTSLLRCTLETGRTHQIRVHLRSIGRPVVGDRTYGGVRRGIKLDRPFLHSTEVEFVHPVTGETLAFESSMPSDLTHVLSLLAH